MKAVYLGKELKSQRTEYECIHQGELNGSYVQNHNQ